MFIRVLVYTAKEQLGKSPQMLFSCQQESESGRASILRWRPAGGSARPLQTRVELSRAFAESVDFDKLWANQVLEIINLKF